MRRTGGAIFQVTVPATIMKSAWRGEGRKISAPKRAISKRGAAAAIISMAQQARPNMAGQREELRAQLSTLSTEVISRFRCRDSSRSSKVVSLHTLASLVYHNFVNGQGALALNHPSLPLPPPATTAIALAGRRKKTGSAPTKKNED